MGEEGERVSKRKTGMRVAAAAMMLAAMVCGQAARAQVGAPAETQVSAQVDLLDPEFSQSRGRLVWADSTGSLWLATVNRLTGAIVPANGKGTLIDADAMTSNDLRITTNGPEWVSTALGDQVVYTKFLPGLPHSKLTARLAYAAQRLDGVWEAGFLGSAARLTPYASSDPRDEAPRITYVDPAGNHYWRDLRNPGSDVPVPGYPASMYSLRHVEGQRAVVYFAPDATGSVQLFRHWPDSGSTDQLTADSGHDTTTNVPWMWQAPEYGGELLMAVLADYDRELRVYRWVDRTQPYWTVIQTFKAPDGGMFGSPEPFVHNGRSYLVMHGSVAATLANPTRIYLAAVDAANPWLSQLTPDEPARSRRDPEVFVTASGPKIYFNRLTLSSSSYCLVCNEGLFMADTGLGPAVP